MVLDCLQKQNLPHEDFEVLIINNNSPDKTDDIIKAYQRESNLPIRYFIEYNQGISFARNRGVKEANGEIIVFLDDDETVDSNFLSIIKDFFTDYGVAGITAGPVIPVFEKEKPQWLSKFIERAITGEYYKGHKIKELSPKDYPGTGHACFRKELFLKYGEFNTDLGRKGNSLMGAEDKDFFLRLMKGNEKCYYVPEARIYHHIPADKLTEFFFNNISYAIGKSERIRTLSLGKTVFYKRLLQEMVKWIASIVLWLGYLVLGQKEKSRKIITFRKNVSKGLLNH